MRPSGTGLLVAHLDGSKRRAALRGPAGL